jgi:hypothetical protein
MEEELPPPQPTTITVPARNPATHRTPTARFLREKILETFIVTPWMGRSGFSSGSELFIDGTELYLPPSSNTSASHPFAKPLDSNALHFLRRFTRSKNCKEKE